MKDETKEEDNGVRLRYQIHVWLDDGDIIQSKVARETQQDEIEMIKNMASQTIAGQWDSFSIDIEDHKWIAIAQKHIKSITVTTLHGEEPK